LALTSFRACVDRLAGDGGHTIATEMEETSAKGLHYIDVRDDKGEMTKAALEIKFKRIAILPPIGKQNRHPALDLTVIHASERGAPIREAIRRRQAAQVTPTHRSSCARRRRQC